MSLSVLVSVYKRLKEPIKQHTAVRYINRLRRTALNRCLQQTVTQSYSSKEPRPYRSQVHFVAVAAFWMHSVKSDEDVCGKEFDIYRAGEG
jgi:hypothetical protein